MVDFDEENNECIPRELTDAVENGKVDKEEYEGYSGNVRSPYHTAAYQTHLSRRKQAL